MTGGKVKTKLSCRFRHLKVREFEFQPHLPTFFVHKWSGKSRHGLQWSASNYFSPFQLKTRPKVPKIRLLKHHPTPSRFFWLFCLQIKIMGSNQKSPLQIFDIWCKNISFSPGSKFRLLSGGGREVSYSAYLPHFLFNSDMKTWASSKISSLHS